MLRNATQILLISTLLISCNQFNQEEKEKAAKYDSLMSKTGSEIKGTDSSTPTATSIYSECISSVVTIGTDNGALGSGFFVKPNIIATNYHVIKGSNSVKIKLFDSGEHYNISGYVAVDISNDLILLQCDEVKRTPLTVSNSLPQTGEQVYVIGSPIGLEASFSNGIVSGLRNTGSVKLIQLTAPISPGNSGGPVLNKDKEVIGISVMYLKLGQNLNFAVPSQELNSLISFIESYPTELSALNRIDESYFAEQSPQSENNSEANPNVEFREQYKYTSMAYSFAPVYDIASAITGTMIYRVPSDHLVYVLREVENNYVFVYCDGHRGYMSKGMLK